MSSQVVITEYSLFTALSPLSLTLAKYLKSQEAARRANYSVPDTNTSIHLLALQLSNCGVCVLHRLSPGLNKVIGVTQR